MPLPPPSGGLALLSRRQASGLDCGLCRPPVERALSECPQGAPCTVTPWTLSCVRWGAGCSTLAEGVPGLRGEETVAHRPAEEESVVQPFPEGSEPVRLRGPARDVPYDQQWPHR